MLGIKGTRLPFSLQGRLAHPGCSQHSVGVRECRDTAKHVVLCPGMRRGPAGKQDVYRCKQHWDCRLRDEKKFPRGRRRSVHRQKAR